MLLRVYLPTVAGCLRCLKVMAADVDSEQAPGLLQSLSAELAEIVTNPQTPAGLAATCFNIMAQLTSALASLAGKYQRQVCRWFAALVQHTDMCRLCELHTCSKLGPQLTPAAEPVIATQR